MAHIERKLPVDIQSMVEQQPFSEPAAQSFLTEWCKVNDSIVPNFVSRQEWSKQVKRGVLSERPDGKKNLNLPNDVHLWELIGLMEAVDEDTFAQDPDKAKERSEQLRDFGKTLKNAGVYIAQRMDAITPNSQFAEIMSKKLFLYGNALVGDQKEQPDLSIKDIQSNTLTTEEVNATDKWLAGPKLYESRMKRLRGKHGDREAQEELRRKTLQQFFRAADRAMKLQTKGLKKNESFYSPVHSRFLETIESNLRSTIEKPKREFITTFFRRGIEKLAHEMKDPEDYSSLAAKLLNMDEFKNLSRSLRDSLKIEKLKQELADIRRSTPVELVAKRELEVAMKIRNKILALPYQTHANNPSGMVANQEINCLGGCLLAGALFKDLGINFLHVSLPRHAVLFPVLRSGRIFYFDFVNKDIPPTEIADEDIEGKTNSGSQLFVRDLAATAKNSKAPDVSFDFISEKFATFSSEWIESGVMNDITASNPESGQEIALLNNFAFVLMDMGLHRQAVHAIERIIEHRPHDGFWYSRLASIYQKLNEREGAFDVINKGLKNASDYSTLYDDAYELLRDEGRLDEGISMLERGIQQAKKNTQVLYRALIHDLLYRRVDLSGALQKAQENITKNGINSSAYWQRGSVYGAMESWDEALNDYELAITLDPQDMFSHFERGKVLQHLKRYHEALLEFQQVQYLAKEKNSEWGMDVASEHIEAIEKILSSSE